MKKFIFLLLIFVLLTGGCFGDNLVFSLDDNSSYSNLTAKQSYGFLLGFTIISLSITTPILFELFRMGWRTYK